jgi:hypothetical protein
LSAPFWRIKGARDIVERFDLKCDSRLGEEELLRRLAKAELPGNGAKYFDEPTLRSAVGQTVIRRLLE